MARKTLWLLALAWAGGASAHHSATMFDVSKCLTVVGTVRTVEWTYPHAWIWVNVLDENGVIQTWAFEGAEPLVLERFGWSRSAIAVGDKITVRFSPLKDGRRGGQWARVITAAGRSLIGQPLACNSESAPYLQGNR